MPKVSDEHRMRMRRRILDAALACVARKGFAAVSMADIIGEAGLSAGAVYLYYGSKEQLTQDIARNVLEPRIAAINALLTADPIPPPSQVVTELMRAVAETAYFPTIAVQVWGDIVHQEGDIADFARSVVERVTEALADYLAAWLVAARDLTPDEASARASDLAPAVFGMAQGFVLQSALTKGAVDERYLRSVHEVLAAL